MRWQSSLKAPSRKERCALLYQLGWLRSLVICTFLLIVKSACLLAVHIIVTWKEK